MLGGKRVIMGLELRVAELERRIDTMEDQCHTMMSLCESQTETIENLLAKVVKEEVGEELYTNDDGLYDFQKLKRRAKSSKAGKGRTEETE